MKTKLLVLALATLVPATALGQTQELMSVESTFSRGGTELRRESSYSVMTPKHQHLLRNTSESFERLRICRNEAACYGGGGGPQFLAEFKAVVAKIKEACAGIHDVVVRPKRGATDTVTVATHQSSLEVSGISAATALVIGRKIVGPPISIYDTLTSVTIKCNRTQTAATPDVNSVHDDNDVCHGTTCLNASTDQANNECPQGSSCP